MNGHQKSSISLERPPSLHIFFKGQKYKSLPWCWKARIDMKKPRSFYHLRDLFHEIFLRKKPATFGASNGILLPSLFCEIEKLIQTVQNCTELPCSEGQYNFRNRMLFLITCSWRFLRSNNLIQNTVCCIFDLMYYKLEFKLEKKNSWDLETCKKSWETGW